MDNKPGLIFYFTVSHEHVGYINNKLKKKHSERSYPLIQQPARIYALLYKVASPWPKFQQPTAIESARVSFCPKLLGLLRYYFGKDSGLNSLLIMQHFYSRWLANYALRIIKHIGSGTKAPRDVFVFKLLFVYHSPKGQFTKVS